MGTSGESRKRNLDELRKNLDEFSPKRSRTVSSPSDPSSSSSGSYYSTATSTATTTAAESSQHTVSDSGKSSQDEAQQQKSEKSDSVENEGDEGIYLDSYTQEILSELARDAKDDEENRVDHEHLFDGEERDSYKTYCTEKIFCHISPHVYEDPSSPFIGEDDEVDLKFASFLSEFPGEEGDDAYLGFRRDPNEVTVALSREEIKELDDSEPFWASAQHIDTYLYCRLKLFPREIKERINQCSAYMISLNMKDLDDWKDRTPLSILEKALEVEMKEVDFNIIPLLYQQHWTLAIVCGLGQQQVPHLPSVPFRLPCVLHLNSLIPHGIKKCHTYAIATAVAKKAHIDSDQVGWHNIQCPQQNNTKDCGFYTMRFAVDFVKNISSPNYLPVHDLFSLLKVSSRYFLNKEDKDEITWVAKKSRQQLKGFIGSIQPGERDWMNEFSEGRQCAIDTLPYCIPEKILEHSGNECKVKMLNYVRAEHVPFDYVMQHWKHIYDDYVSSNQTDERVDID